MSVKGELEKKKRKLAILKLEDEIAEMEEEQKETETAETELPSIESAEEG